MTKINSFLAAIETGLSSEEKYISSHFFYDKIGDQLFQKIMELPEYYLTKSEMEIFKYQSAKIVSSWAINKNTEFELIELGAGDGKKTQFLLKYLLEEGYNFSYLPVDISENSLNVISSRLHHLFPNLKIRPMQGEYFEVLDRLFLSKKPKIVLFIGSNLGNLEDEIAHDFLKKIANKLKMGEKLLLGLDLIKTKEIVLPAYNDANGVTRDFNLNLLKRINKDLKANFKLENFTHAPEYDENEGIAKSFLQSRIDHDVEIKALNRTFHFAKKEKIHTEISRKYDDQILKTLINQISFEISAKFLDSKKYFADYILTKI